MFTSSFSASVALRLKIQRRKWSFVPRKLKSKISCGGDRANYDNIVIVYLGLRDRMLRILNASHVPSWDHDDILQEIVTSALDHGGIRDIEKWMIGALRFQIITYFRRHRRFITKFTHLEPLVLDLVNEAQLRIAIEDEIGFWHARLDIQKALRVLTPRMQWLMLMRARGYSVEEVSKMTGYAPNSIRKLYRRGIVLLRETLTSEVFVRLR